MTHATRAGRIARATLVLTLAWTAHTAAQQTLTPINYMSASPQSSGVFVTANYNGQCPSRPIRAQLFLVSGGVATYQSTCFINPAWNSYNNSTIADANVGFCPYRVPRTQNPANTTLLRLWRSTADCNLYADQAGRLDPGAYQDVWVNGYSPSTYFYGLNAGSLITVDKPAYRLKMDRNGGATYEFYSKRARLNGAPFEANALLPDVGAALQVALHHNIQNGGGIGSGSCDPGQGYWNPTQAGNFCASGGGIGAAQPAASVICDGVNAPACTTANASVQLGAQIVRNWDYGTQYPGPVNPGDTLRLSQALTATDHYAMYDVTITHVGTGTRTGAFIEMPTFYFNGDYRRWTVSRGGTKIVHTVPDRLGNLPLTPQQLGLTLADFNPNDRFNHEDVSWVGFENVRGTTSDAYTIAWFYKPAFRADVAHPRYAYTISETEVYRNIKFSNVPTFNLAPGKAYPFRYVVFPYRHDAVISGPYGANITVEETIARMKADYER